MPDESPSQAAGPTSSDWSAARGDKWSAHLSGMEATLSAVDEPLIRALQLDGPCRIAEVGCGGGGTTLEILRRAPAGSVIHGFDISPNLIELARKRPRPDPGTLAFEVADVARAKPERPYDRLASRFGVMFFEDADAAFANLAHWLERGGWFAFAVWGPVSDNPWMTTVRDVVAALVEVPQPAPDAPGPFRYADPDAFRSVLERAGFAKVDVQEWRGALPIGGGLAPAEAARFALSAFSSFEELLEKASAAARTEAQRSLTASFSRHQRQGAVRMDACVRIVAGSRP